MNQNQSTHIKITPELAVLLKDYMKKDSHHLSKFNQEKLNKELVEAEIIKDEDLPADIIKLNSEVKLVDISTKKEMILQIVPADDANPSKGKISILSPFSIALIGYGEGSVIEWEMPSYIKNFKILEVNN